MQMYKDLLAAFMKEFPWVETKGIFYNDTGSKMQKLEGEIALKMIEWGMNEQIPIIAVHDSFAVQTKHEQKTWAKMQEFWAEVVEEQKLRSSCYGLPRQLPFENCFGQDLS